MKARQICIWFLLAGAFILAPVPAWTQYGDSLFKPVAGQVNSFFNGEASIAWVLTGGNPRPGGLHLGVGFNVARFFNRSMVAGIFAEGKFYKGPLENMWSPDFQQVVEQNDGELITLARQTGLREHFTAGVANKPGYSFIGNYYYRLGLQFSLRPASHGGLLLRTYIGTYGFPLSGPFTGLYRETEFLVLSLPLRWGAEIIAKPFANGKNQSHPWKKFRIKNRFIVGIFAEQVNWNKARFHNQPLNRVLVPAFFDEVPNPVRLGIKAGIGMY